MRSHVRAVARTLFSKQSLQLLELPWRHFPLGAEQEGEREKEVVDREDPERSSSVEAAEVAARPDGLEENPGEVEERNLVNDPKHKKRVEEMQKKCEGDENDKTVKE